MTSESRIVFWVPRCFLWPLAHLVLVPLLTGLDPNVALFTAGAGTLIFQVVTRGKIPIFLASSFAFLPPIMYGVKAWGIPGTMCGLCAAGFVYVILSFLIRWQGSDVIKKVLPPVVTGPVIMVIGLILAPVAVNMAMGKTGDASFVLFPQRTAMFISLTSLAATVVVSILGKGILRLIPHFVWHCHRICAQPFVWYCGLFHCVQGGLVCPAGLCLPRMEPAGHFLHSSHCHCPGHRAFWRCAGHWRRHRQGLCQRAGH